ncbi:MAG: GntR family transcriptional regulator [Tetrasphaera jenkinsii]|jgi:DNA-binding transcriptional regulator YhcF (GntR family)|nr:GntR family transcriptional regulator [Tetrasphaera jenkinsii]
MRLSVDPGLAVAAYEQIVAQIRDAVDRGELATGTKLPTVRQLAGDLGLATNTVARAYRELESTGVVTTNRRNGTVVSAAPAAAPNPEVEAAAVLFVHAARRGGLDLTRALGLIRESW